MPELNPITAPDPATSGRPATNGALTIKQVNVGQGNLTYVICPNGKRVLIDVGSDDMTGLTLQAVANNLDYAFPYVKGSKTNLLYVDLVIFTHGDTDHYNKVTELVGKSPVQQVYIGGPVGAYKLLKFREWLYTVKGNVACKHDNEDEEYKPRIEQIIINGTEGHQSPLLLCDGTSPGGPTCEIWALAGTVASGPGETEVNANSLVVKITFGNTSALITGDATKATEDFLRTNPHSSIPLTSNLLLVPHHGSEGSSTPLFVQAVAPKIAIISAKNGNDHGLPRRSIVQYYVDQPGMLTDLGEAQSHSIATYGGVVAVLDPMSTTKAIWQTGVSGTKIYVSDGVNLAPPP